MTLRACFREKFSSRAVIIDCFEVFIDRPSCLLARAQTWSSYKHHNTAKFLIGITPQGTVSFILKGWGGRASDKFITEHCGLWTDLASELLSFGCAYHLANNSGRIATLHTSFALDKCVLKNSLSRTIVSMCMPFSVHTTKCEISIVSSFSVPITNFYCSFQTFLMILKGLSIVTH